MINGHFFRDGDDYVVVIVGMPGTPVQMGVGESPEEALADVSNTPIESGGNCIDVALNWASGQGWITSAAELVEVEIEEEK